MNRPTGAEASSVPTETLTEGWKNVPQNAGVRAEVRASAAEIASTACRCRPLDFARLQALGKALLGELGLDQEFLGFAMVTTGSAFWRESFEATPCENRLLLLPHCLRDPERCRGTYEADGMTCARCGACVIGPLLDEAETLGYTTLVAEGTPAVLRTLAEGRVRAILGVACLDSMEKCFNLVLHLEVPYAGIPLLRDGCINTQVEVDQVRALLRARRAGQAAAASGGYAELLRTAGALLKRDHLRSLLDRHTGIPWSAATKNGQTIGRAESVAVDWLSEAGKRFRPFMTLAAYAAMEQARTGEADPGKIASRLPEAVACVAVATEMFHKASLVHDDVEDSDAYRYGQPTVHARYGIPTAVNTGDLLLGVGYQLVAAQKADLGADAVTDTLAILSEAHVGLSRGQGAELGLTPERATKVRPNEMLQIYALKTAPAFKAALLAGLRAAGPIDRLAEPVARFCRHLGVAYQVLDDQDDVRAGGPREAGEDALAGRPTLLRAFANEAGRGEELASLIADGEEPGGPEAVERVRALYRSAGVFEKANGLVAKCRARAEDVARAVEPEPLRDLMLRLLEIVLDR